MMNRLLSITLLAATLFAVGCVGDYRAIRFQVRERQTGKAIKNATLSIYPVFTGIGNPPEPSVVSTDANGFAEALVSEDWPMIVEVWSEGFYMVPNCWDEPFNNKYVWGWRRCGLSMYDDTEMQIRVFRRNYPQLIEAEFIDNQTDEVVTEIKPVNQPEQSKIEKTDSWGQPDSLKIEPVGGKDIEKAGASPDGKQPGSATSPAGSGNDDPQVQWQLPKDEPLDTAKPVGKTPAKVTDPRDLEVNWNSQPGVQSPPLQPATGTEPPATGIPSPPSPPVRPGDDINWLGPDNANSSIRLKVQPDTHTRWRRPGTIQPPGTPETVKPDDQINWQKP